jgi:hypothetical protein
MQVFLCAGNIDQGAVMLGQGAGNLEQGTGMLGQRPGSISQNPVMLDQWMGNLSHGAGNLDQDLLPYKSSIFAFRGCYACTPKPWRRRVNGFPVSKYYLCVRLPLHCQLSFPLRRSCLLNLPEKKDIFFRGV